MERNIVLENVGLMFRNFSGKVDTYNKLGKRTVTLLISKEDADRLADIGFMIKEREVDNDVYIYTLKTEISFKHYPPKIVLIDEDTKQQKWLTEETVSECDVVDIACTDVIINPYAWTTPDNSGVKAYVKAMYITVESDPLARKYASEQYDEVPFS